MREKYESLSLATLKDLAKARGLKGISTLRKPELIERMLEEDEKEKASAGSAESKNTEHRQEESAREENRVREPRASYDTSERKNYQMVMDLSAVPIICRVRMTFMYLHPRSDVLT